MQKRAISNIDLSNHDEQERQKANALRFERRRARLIFGFALLVFIGLTAKSVVSLEDEGYVVAVMFANLLFILFSIFKCKCPNCGALPTGHAISAGQEISYSKGVNPFPKKCSVCGFYLSRRFLTKEIRKVAKGK